MKAIIKAALRRSRVCLDLVKFSMIRRCLGFDQANAFLRRVGKHSIIPILNAHGAQIGKNCDIEVPLIFHNCTDFSNLIIGNNIHLGKDCFLDLKEKIVIGDNVIVSMRATFITHIDMNGSVLSHFYPSCQKPIHVHRDSYIGTGVTILMGVNMGSASFASAGAVVTSDVPPGTLVGGVPARELKKFPMEEVNTEII